MNDEYEHEREGNGSYIQVQKFLTGNFYSPAVQFHGKQNHKIICAVDLNLEKILSDHGQHLRSSITRNYSYRQGDEVRWATRDFTMQLGDDIWVEMQCSGASQTLSCWSSSSREAAQSLVQDWIKTYQRPKPKRDSRIQFFMIEDNGGICCARTVRGFKSYPKSSKEKCLNYGDDFLNWEKGLISQLKRESSGLVICSGPPGTGKTCFVRNLIRTLRRSHRFYFVPVHEFMAMSAPSMSKFWIDECTMHPGKKLALILEDAECLVTPRGPDNSNGVSALLSLSDGLLSEILPLKLIVTLNCRTGALDPAVTRQGRLLNFREFRRLTSQEAQRLATAKGLTLPSGQTDFSLAEIYHSSPTPLTTADSRRLGFAAIPAPLVCVAEGNEPVATLDTPTE